VLKLEREMMLRWKRLSEYRGSERIRAATGGREEIERKREESGRGEKVSRISLLTSELWAGGALVLLMLRTAGLAPCTQQQNTKVSLAGEDV